MSSIESYLVNGEPIDQDHVNIRLLPEECRCIHPSKALEDYMEQLWLEQLKKQPNIFNGSKFRLVDSELTSTGTLNMTWGLTSYKEYICTCSNATIASQLVRDGGMKYLSRKVGVAAALVTKDNNFVLIQRSNAVGVYANLVDVPGGHPEPEKLRLHHDIKWAASEELNAECVSELFKSIVEEVEEEINIPRARLQSPLLLGVTLQAPGETPSYAFLIRSDVSTLEVETYYRTAKDQYESTRLLCIQLESLDSTALQLTPSATGCLQLAKTYLLAKLE
ncbi:hypothetical protein THRCLA_01686 [Thraustotheca clavata]|uniref:Nudix hydrolase domain-containing protein n=1 Tax=Thraustotheca clavata TaxID=74557 RepID=A0A1W0A7V2_9STRA|nr:hypothetical protein THRCLA_01686 [Thraustotheca clavata]